jgi:hypothetical protein
MEPRIQYARTSDGVNIAYHSFGDGEPLVYLSPGGHLGQSWQYHEARAWLERIGANSYRLRAPPEDHTRDVDP